MNPVKTTTNRFKTVFDWKVNLKKMGRDAALCFIVGYFAMLYLKQPYENELKIALVLFGALGGSIRDMLKLFLEILGKVKQEGDNSDAN